MTGIARIAPTAERGPDARPAPVWRRVASMAYDAILLAALFFVVTAIGVARSGAAVDAGTLWLQLLLAATGWLYLTWCWVHSGQTVAMRAWKIRLASSRSDSAPGQVGWTRATTRLVAAWLPALPICAISVGAPAPMALGLTVIAFLAGFAAAAASDRKACWYDLIAGTQVVLAD